jgi:type IV pilus assembly protein PilM
MEKYPVVWGLDIGHSSIKAAKLSRNGNSVTVLGYAIEPIAATEDGDRDEAVVKALQQLAQQEDIGGIPVIASLSGRQIFSRTINIPVLNAKKVDRMVELEARQQIPGNFDEVEWGYHLSPAADGTSNDVALFAARRDITQELIRKCKRAGINLVGVSVSSLALYNFVRFDQEFPEDETVIILDVGAENTDLVLYQGDTLWMRSLALSGNDITKVFMKKFRVSFEEAETLKRQIGDSRQAEKILKVLEGTLNELTSEVQRSLGFYKSQNTTAKLENIVISGNTFRLPSLPEYLAERLRYTVNILEDLDKIQVAGGIDREHFLRDLQSLGVAIGLALQGTGVAKANVNLLPSTLQIERVLKTKRWAGVALVVVLAAAFFSQDSIVNRVIRENNEMTARIKHIYDDNESRVKESRAELAKVEPLARDLKSYDAFGSKGVAHAILEGVLSTAQDLIKEKGQVNVSADAKPIEEGGEPPLQAIYIVSIDYPQPLASKLVDPFRPIEEPRLVHVKVHIPFLANDPLKDVHQSFVDRLKVLPVPEYLHGFLHGDHLFIDAVEVQSVTLPEVAYYVNKNNLDASGRSQPIQEEVKVKMHEVTFKCQIFGGSAAAAISAPAPVSTPAGNDKADKAKAKEAGK